MVSKLTAAAIFLGASLLTIPVHAVHAESPNPPSPQASVNIDKTPAKQESKPAEFDKTEIDKINLNYVTGYAVDTGRLLAAPLRWETKDWLKFGLVVGGTSTLFLVDDDIKNFAQKNQSPVVSKFASVGNFVGSPLYIYPSLGTFYLYGYLADDHKARRASLLALESLTISGALASGIKVIGRRHRPNTGHKSTKWDGPDFDSDNVSFLSGHTSSAFATATIFAEEYKDNKYVPTVAYGLATLVGLSRIYSNEHWSSDAMFGAALGYFISKSVLSYHKEDKNKLGNRLLITPQVGKEMTGLKVDYNF